MNRLRQMAIFAHVVEAGSVSAAADKLNVSKSVVSQHLKTLENELGMVLMKRTTRRQTLTDVGEQFYLRCKELNTIAESAWDIASDYQTEPQGRFRITASHALMDSLVAPVIAELMTQYPKLKPELIADDQHLDLMANDIDMAIRIGPSHDSSLKQKRIGEFRDVLCGLEERRTKLNESPYIANVWQPKQIEHHFRSAEGQTWIYRQQASCTANSFHTCLALIRSGAGVGIVPDFYLSERGSQLVNVVPNYTLPINTVYTLTPYSSHTPTIVKLCTDYLEQALGKRLS
ncbi:LysR family transcriptional regulator [Vibrio cholerae]|uniref:LysR family transcriptional regulator n=1 Tax=Vibrio paracholerae TaxID=650003 RepID=UPI000DE35835|nr:LysR family transcriptional regulator [Vibrio paracholerae]ELJ8547916.1 LysR family transcriptional regulator [Vibrio cholerae]ELY5187694.1 LysR family transcriptional regulator [Vibrio cholerae]ELY5288180.1 LysR family transcriptional regulator [Vibrio cholerae]RBM73675.1 LysR family transcriptional regulator [Vibrio paracholerae]